MSERLVADVVVQRLQQWGVPRVFGYSGDGINALMGALRRAGEPQFDPDVPLLPPFPAGAEKLASFRAGLDQEGAAGTHARALLDTYADQERRRRT
jgi:hypothetical protein